MLSRATTSIMDAVEILVDCAHLITTTATFLIHKSISCLILVFSFATFQFKNTTYFQIYLDFVGCICWNNLKSLYLSNLCCPVLKFIFIKFYNHKKIWRNPDISVNERLYIIVFAMCNNVDFDLSTLLNLL